MVEIIHEPLDLAVALGDFESIKRYTGSGKEFWSARDLQAVAGYQQWRQFQDAVERAKISSENQGLAVSDHFADARKMVQVGSGAEREVQDYWITRYGCYLVFQNGDPRKPEIASAQRYFAVRTREAEVQRPPTELSRIEILQLAMDAEQERVKAIERAEEAEEIVEAVNSNRGLNCRKFHKHYFPDVAEREFFELLYSAGLLIDQRNSRWHPRKEKWVNGYEHMHPTYKGKPYFILDGPIRDGKRRESTYVRPGAPEVALRDLLIKKGLPAPAAKEIAA